VDVGNVVVQQLAAQDVLIDYSYGIDFAFAHQAFFPDGEIIVQ
jgi:hypothetical protein